MCVTAKDMKQAQSDTIPASYSVLEVVESPGGEVFSPSATMTSLQALRELINERLTAAAGEISTAFQQTIVQLEEEVGRQRKLLEISSKLGIKRLRTGLEKCE